MFQKFKSVVVFLKKLLQWSDLSSAITRSSAGNNFSLFTGHMSFQIFLLVGHLTNWTGHIYWLTTPWRRELKMCWWDVRSSCPIIMWNWPDIFKICSDNVWCPKVISSTAKCNFLSGSSLKLWQIQQNTSGFRLDFFHFNYLNTKNYKDNSLNPDQVLLVKTILVPFEIKNQSLQSFYMHNARVWPQLTI